LVADTGEYALMLACKRRGIPFAELQHGVFNAGHPDAIPADIAGTTAELLLPDHFLARGQYWIDELSSTRQGRGQTRAVGNAQIDVARMHRAASPVRDHVRLVITSQGLASDELGQWIDTMLDAAPAGRQWKVMLKLHPVYDADRSAFAPLERFGDRLRIIGGAESPNVYELLAEADLHLSIASACHFDAASLGVASVILALPGHEEIRHIVDNAQFFLAERAEDVWMIVDQLGRHKPEVERFCAGGFVGNMDKLMAVFYPAGSAQTGGHLEN
jgi:hypothetical protein